MKNNKPKKKKKEIDWETMESNLDNITQEQLDYQAEQYEAEAAFWDWYWTEGFLDDDL